jgi:periplasmic copper chaperone A
MPLRPRRQATARRALALLLTAAVLGCSAGGEPAIEVGPAQAAPPVAGSSQIVVDVTNRGDGADLIVGATTPVAIGVEIHRTTIDDGRAVMRELDDLDVPAGETVRFRPGDLHLMLVVPDETVVVGGTFELTLEFDRSDPVTVPVEVVQLLDLVDDPGSPTDELEDAPGS